MNIQTLHAAPIRNRPGDAVHRGRHSMRGLFALVALLLAAFAGMAWASSKEAQQKELRAMASQTLEELYRHQPQARDVINRAAGYAVFSNFGMKILVAGTGKGKGVAVDNRTGRETFMKMLELQAGLGLGLRKYRLVWVFEDEAAFKKFITTGRQLGGQASFSAKAEGKGGGVAGAASVDKGVWLYQLTDKGLSAEISVKASKYYKDAELN